MLASAQIAAYDATIIVDLLMARQDILFARINKNGLGLEIGPSHNPVAPKRQGFNVEIVDHLDQQGLIEKYRHHGVDVDAIEPVDYVWSGEPLSELIADTGRYDWIIASHVIEHVPDVIGFLDECQKLLKPAGVLSLAVPDKRFCFDHFRPISSTGDLIQAHLEKRRRHPPGWVFDYFSSAASLNGVITWVQGNRGTLKYIHPIEQARQLFMSSLAQDSPYIDIHGWRFTPSSFRLVLLELRFLELIGLNEVCFVESRGCEFFVSLSADSAPIALDRLQLARQVERELAEAVL